MRNFKEFMFRPYIDYAIKYDLYNTLVPSWDNPEVIIILVAMAFMMGKNAINVSRQLCGLVVALLIFRLAFLALGSADAVWPSTRFLVIGAACLIWLVLSAFVVDESLKTWLRALWRKVVS